MVKQGFFKRWHTRPAFGPLLLLFSAWVSKNHISHPVSWSKAFYSSHHLKPVFLVLQRLAHSSQPQLWSTPSGSRSKLPLLRRLCWRLVLSDRTSKDVVLRRTAKSKSSRPLWTWTSETWDAVYIKKKKRRPGGCHMVRHPFDAGGRETASTFNISQPLVCSGSLLPYSDSHCGLFIYELPIRSPTNSPNLALSTAIDGGK